MRSSLIAGLALLISSAFSEQAFADISVNSCTTLSVAGNYVVTQDLSTSGGATCITIDGDDVHLNLGGFTVSADGSGIGILLDNVTGVHVNNGYVEDFATGIQLDNADANHLNGLIVTDNTGDGILIMNGSDDNHVNGSTSSDNGGFGVRVLNSNGNKFNTMFVKNNDTGGYRFVDSDNNEVTSNDISCNGRVGVLIRGDSDGNTIRGSNISNTESNGVATTGIIIIEDADNNVIRGNTVNNNQNGISIGCPTGCATISGATTGANGNLLQSNTTDDNEVDGIQIGVGNTSNTVKSNSSFDNGGQDLRDYNPVCDNNDWSSNDFGTANQACVE